MSARYLLKRDTRLSVLSAAMSSRSVADLDEGAA